MSAGSNAESTDNIDSFYASFEAETTSLSLVQHNNSNASLTTTSEETKKALLVLRDLASNNFSFLMHPGRSIFIKDTLNRLLSLPPDEGVSMRAKSAMLQLSTSFAQWSLDYDNAMLKLKSATEELTKFEKVKHDLETNVKCFQKMDTMEKDLCDKLAILQEEKRDLEEKINAINAEIADFTEKKESVAESKIEMFHKGRVIKVERDDLRNKVPRLKAEQEWAKTTKANIEAEWSKLGEQFIGSIGF